MTHTAGQLVDIWHERRKARELASNIRSECNATQCMYAAVWQIDLAWHRLTPGRLTAPGRVAGPAVKCIATAADARLTATVGSEHGVQLQQRLRRQGRAVDCTAANRGTRRHTPTKRKGVEDVCNDKKNRPKLINQSINQSVFFRAPKT